MLTRRIFFNILLCVIFFSGVFIWVSSVKENTDFYYHLKAGEIFLQKGILYKDIFSYTAQGREWSPYEWLFQVGLAFVERLVGFAGIPYILATIAVITLGSFFLFIKRFFSLSTATAIGISVLCFCSTVEFYVPRPQMFTFLFFILTIAIILIYFEKGKNYLYLLIPITWFWTNMQSSVVFAIYCTGSYALLAFYQYKKTKEKIYLKRAWILTITTLGISIITLLPPLGLSQYRLLFLFMTHLQEIRIFGEWVPIQNNLLLFSIFFILCSVIIIPFFYFSKKSKKSILWVLPLLIFLLLPFSAQRNVSYSYIILYIMGASLCSFFPRPSTKSQKIFVGLIIVILSIACIGIFYLKRYKPTIYPVGAVHFVQKNHLQGHMLNELINGGYILYYLYPEQKVFIDLRADVYLCCELKSYKSLLDKTYLSDEKYLVFFNQFANKYSISYILIDTRYNGFIKKLGKVLPDDSDWSLVYFDDVSEIYVKKNGVNTNIIRQFGTTAVTPYGTNPYRKGMEKKALTEYQRMENIAPSAKSENAIGLLLLQSGKVNEATQSFKKALQNNKDFTPAYLNLAAIALSKKDYKTAIADYERVRVIDPTNSTAYLYEGEIYSKIYSDNQKAQEIWQQGLQNVTDINSQRKLQELLN